MIEVINLAIIFIFIALFIFTMAYFMPTHWTEERDITSASDKELEQIFKEVNDE